MLPRDGCELGDGIVVFLVDWLLLLLLLLVLDVEVLVVVVVVLVLAKNRGSVCLCWPRAKEPRPVGSWQVFGIGNVDLLRWLL